MGEGRLLIDLYIVFLQEAWQTRKRKASFFYFVARRIDGIIKRGSEVRLFQECVIKDGPGQIAVVEDGAGQITFGEVHFVELAVFEKRFFYFYLIERGVVKRAGIEVDLESEWISMFKVQSPHLTALEPDITEEGLSELDQAQVSVDEGTFYKEALGEIGIGKVSILKSAIVVFTLSQGAGRLIKSFVGKGLSHLNLNGKFGVNLNRSLYMDNTLQFIGRIHSPLKSLEDCPRQPDEEAPGATIEIFPAYREGIKDIRAGAEIILLTWLHQADRQELATHPRGDLQAPLTGVFSTRSPNRPNPIGMHTVKVVSVTEEGQVVVGALEALDGTPVVDIKPVW